MNKTKIPWVQNPDGTPGYTWNPITGCLNGCEYCYARQLANGRLKSRMLANQIFPVGQFDDAFWRDKPLSDPFYPRLWPERLEKHICYENSPERGIFVCSMGELFAPWVPEEWTEKVLLTIKSNPQNRYYLLTKQPRELAKWSPFPPNCWVGVTATDHNMLQAATGHFRYIKATVKFVSIEPLLRWKEQFTPWLIEDWKAAGINWLIIGAQTKPLKWPEPEWVRELVAAADAAGVPVFIKPPLSEWAELPYEVHYRQIRSDGGTLLGEVKRQEMPK